MPNPDGSIDTNNWRWDDNNELPTLGADALNWMPRATPPPFTGQSSPYGMSNSIYGGASSPTDQQRNAAMGALFQGGQGQGQIPPLNNPPPRPNPFAPIANPFAQIQQWQKNFAPFAQVNAPNNPNVAPNVAPPNQPAGMSRAEAMWKQVADRMGLDWNVTKAVYMNPNRNGSPSPAAALDRQMDDKIWGDAAFRAGILTGNADHDAIVWRDHYNAGGNWAYDPMVGHNDAIAQVQAAQQNMQNQTNPNPYPDWYVPPTS